MDLHTIYHPNETPLLSEKEDYFRPRYLRGLEPVDRSNLERVVDALKSGMP